MSKSTTPLKIMFVSSKIGTRNALYKNITDLNQEQFFFKGTILFSAWC